MPPPHNFRLPAGWRRFVRWAIDTIRDHPVSMDQSYADRLWLLDRVAIPETAPDAAGAIVLRAGAAPAAGGGAAAAASGGGPVGSDTGAAGSDTCKHTVLLHSPSHTNRGKRHLVRTGRGQDAGRSTQLKKRTRAGCGQEADVGVSPREQTEFVCRSCGEEADSGAMCIVCAECGASFCRPCASAVLPVGALEVALRAAAASGGGPGASDAGAAGTETCPAEAASPSTDMPLAVGDPVWVKTLEVDTSLLIIDIDSDDFTLLLIIIYSPPHFFCFSQSRHSTIIAQGKWIR
eukprot:gene8967-biopygen13718